MKQGERKTKEAATPTDSNNDIEKAQTALSREPETEKPKVPTAEEILAEQERLLSESEARRPKEEARVKEIQESILSSEQQELATQTETLPALPSRENLIDKLVQKYIPRWAGHQSGSFALENILNLKDGVRIEKDIREELRNMGFLKKITSPKQYLHLRALLAATKAGPRVDTNNFGRRYNNTSTLNFFEYVLFNPTDPFSAGGQNPVPEEILSLLPEGWQGTSHYSEKVKETLKDWKTFNRNVDLGNLMRDLDMWWQENEQLRLQKEAEHQLGDGAINEEMKKIEEERKLKEIEKLAGLEE